MKITGLKVENFKAIKHLELNNLSNTVLIAGPNGCGKSCIFHAIRLLKSLIGGYQDNEWHLWLNEFQIRPEDIHHRIVDLFQTNDRRLHIEVDFELHGSEKDFLIKEGKSMLEFKMWKQKIPGFGHRNQYQPQSYKYRPLGVQYDLIYHQEIHPKSQQEFEELKRTLSTQTIFNAKVTANKNGQIQLKAAPVLSLVFSSYEEDLGIIDYNGPDRNYHKETLDNINLNIQTSRQSIMQHSLYNTQNKYANVKQEMAGNYIRELLIKEAGGSTAAGSDLIDTLKELFSEFFPGKKFLGPKPDDKGRIDFPVELPNGKTHDINDLSSGEKEVLYGYLKLRNSAPKNSIILLDEPELHLNPRLISSLPRFYKKHLGDSLGNQLWLVTHSDEFLRQAVEEQNFQVYHLQSSGNSLSYDDNQIKKIDANNKMEKAIIDLVGDLATYAPNKKIVLLEGESSEFDLKMIKNLFPEFEEEVNLLSVGSKYHVGKLHDLLNQARTEKALKTKVFSIVDPDSDNDLRKKSTKQFAWDKYHIENYLLDEYYIAKAVKELTLSDSLNEQKIHNLVIDCAKESVQPLINHKLRQKAWKDTFGKADLSFDPNDLNPARAVYESVKRNLENISKTCNKNILSDFEKLQKEKQELFNNSFEDGSWKSKVKGRDVLKKLVSKIGAQNRISYEQLRNLIISTMARERHKPEGMKKVIQKIIDD